ncbi:uncharacterized protein G2W53_002287 [Senna tora]|uniref:Uncharacterized protein n=1 Tax=Senna tora TaxID=362788 RepID=A0A834XHT8_9FABA|nr:uncharacterized protein G2W53_002287 [Senna tora]
MAPPTSSSSLHHHHRLEGHPLSNTTTSTLFTLTFSIAHHRIQHVAIP